MNDTSLSVIMNNDPAFAELFKKKTVAVKQDKINLVNSAHDYNKKYQNEVDNGTKRLQLLLEDGMAKGLTEKEIYAGITSFIPSRTTPILNFLYFLSQDFKGVESKLKSIMLESSDADIETLKNQYNEKFGHLTHDDLNKESTENQPEMMEYLYGKLTIDTFQKIKKLKALSKSPNESEAFSAYKKCRELCDEHKLIFDQIPCDVN